MKWRNRTQSTNVDDRRGEGGRTGGRLPSIGTILFLWPLIKRLLRSKLGLAILGLGAAAYLASCRLLRVPELDEVLALVRRRS